jgi:hypothetical protein
MQNLLDVADIADVLRGLIREEISPLIRPEDADG